MANLKLNQIVALSKGAKANGKGALDNAYHLIQKHPLMGGISKTYQPRDDDGETLPPEALKLQLRVENILDDLVGPLSRELDLIATNDLGNQLAWADVIVDGDVVLSHVSVSTLLTLEKKLVDFHTLVSKLPILDPSETWSWSDDTESYQTAPAKKTRSKKIPRNHVKAEATDKHPAQVEVYYEDAIVGDWTTIYFSGAISEKRRRELITKVEKLRSAVKVAREQANMTEVTDVNYGAAIFDFLAW